MTDPFAASRHFRIPITSAAYADRRRAPSAGVPLWRFSSFSAELPREIEQFDRYSSFFLIV
jgi:hypothetical protein